MGQSAHSQVHYEVFARKTPSSSWALQMALENRDQAIRTAEELLASRNFAAVMVSKETLDSATGEYRSLNVFTKGTTEQPKKARTVTATSSICSSPQELYTAIARDKIARLLEDWLKRNNVTAFELLHRPDLAEKLEATGTELQHAMQKLAVPESQDTGQDLHELIRRWRALIDKTTTRLITDGRKNLFPDMVPSTLLATIDKLSGHPEKAYVFGGALARVLTKDTRPAVKLEKLLLFASVLAEALPGREWAMQVLEAPVIEIFASRHSLSDVLGQEADLGTSLAVLTRMAAGPEVDKMAQVDPSVARAIPPLKDVLGGYHRLMIGGCFKTLGVSISRRLMQELKGPRRLRPGDPNGEIETLRALALCLVAAGKDDAQREDIREAFAERSKLLISSDFVEGLLQTAKSPIDEIEKLVWLCENVTGSGNKRQAARWLGSSVGGMKFERDIREPGRPVPQRLQWLAQMQRRVLAQGSVKSGDKTPGQGMDKEIDDVAAKFGQFGAQIAGEAHLLANVIRSPAPLLHKLAMLLTFASGQAAPLGAFADQAKAEVMRLIRHPEIRQAIMANPQALAQLKPMMQAAGLAAA